MTKCKTIRTKKPYKCQKNKRKQISQTAINNTTILQAHDFGKIYKDLSG